MVCKLQLQARRSLLGRIFALREFKEAGINLFLTPKCQGRPFCSGFPWYFRICVIEGVKQFLMRSLMLVMNEWVSYDKTMFCCHSKVAYHIFSTELFVPSKLWSSSAHDWCQIVQIWLGLVCQIVQIWSWSVCRLNPTEMKCRICSFAFPSCFSLLETPWHYCCTNMIV